MYVRKFFICFCFLFVLIGVVGATDVDYNGNVTVIGESSVNNNEFGDVDFSQDFDNSVKSVDESYFNSSLKTVDAPFFNNQVVNLNFSVFDDFLNSGNVVLSSSSSSCFFVSQDFVLNHKGLPFVVKLVDNYGNPLDGETVVFSINGVNYNRIVDSEGYARLNINLNNGVYSISFAFNGNSFYSSTSGSRTIKMISTMLTPIMSSNGLVKYYGESVPFKVCLKDNNNQPMKNTDVSIIINGVTYTRTTNDDGFASLNINLLSGKYPTVVKFSGNSYYNPVTLNSQVIVNKKSTYIVANDLIKYYGTVDQFVARLVYNNQGLVNKNLKILINGVTYNEVSDSNGYVYKNINLMPGSYSVSVVYDGDNYYYGCQISKTITVKERFSTSLSGVDVVKYYGDNNYFKVKLTSNGNDLSGKTINFNVNGVVYNSITNSKGEAFLNDNFKAGKYTIIASFSGEADYLASSITKTLTITKRMTNIVADNLITYVGANTTFVVSLKSNGVILKDKTLKFTVDGINYNKVTNNEGIVSLNVNLNVGSHRIDISFGGDDYYSGCSISKTITVKGYLGTMLSVNNVSMFYKSGSSIKAILKDELGNLLVNQNIIFKVNNVDYNRTTDSRGIASLNINLMPGKYTVQVKYEGGENYGVSNVSAEVTVKSTILSNNLVKMYLNNSQFFVTFLDINGNPLVETNVTFNINGMFYTRMTNGDGVAKLNINLGPGSYVISSINPFNGEEKANLITVKSPVVENNDLIKYYKNASKFSVKILGNDGIPVLSGVNVTFNINGVLYTRQTNDEGYCSIAINLRPGDYIITTIYNHYEVSNIIHVLSVILTDDLKINNGDNGIFRAKLVDGRGDPISNEVIVFNIMGVFYQETTDNNGIARLTINRDIGEYVITSQYGDLEISNNITVSNISSSFSESIVFNKSNSILFDDIINAAISLKNHVNCYFVLPDNVIVGGKQLTIFEFSYLMAKMIDDINWGTIESSMYVPYFSKNITYEDHFINLDLSKYTYSNLINSILVCADLKGFMPNNITISEYVIDFKTYTYTFAKMLSYYNMTNSLPLECEFSSVVSNYSYINKNDLDCVYQFGKGLNEYNFESNITPYLVNGTDCEITQRIIALADTLVGNVSSIENQVKIFFKYVMYIPYGPYVSSKGINYVLDNNCGNYIDKTHLFVALCRAYDIPVRYNSAYVEFSSAKLPHLWAQVLIDNWWYVGDTSNTRNSLGFISNWKINSISNLAQGNVYSNLTNVGLNYNGPFKYNVSSDVNFTFNYSSSISNDLVTPSFVDNVSYAKLEFICSDESYGCPLISLKLTDNQNVPLYNKTVLLSILGNLYSSKTDMLGYVDFDVDLAFGNYMAVAIFEGDGKYSSVIANKMLMINKTQAVLSYTDVLPVGSNFKLLLKDIYGNSISNQFIDLKVSNNIYSLKTNDGGFVCVNLNLTTGIYDVKCSFKGNKYYYSVFENFSLSVKNKTQLVGKDMLVNTNDFFTVSLCSEDNFLANEMVEFKILDSDFNIVGCVNKTTNQNGRVNLPIGLNPGKYMICYQFCGTDDYLASYESSNIYVVGDTVKISTIMDGINDEIHVKGEYFKGVLKDSIGNPISNASVEIKVNGMSYTKITDVNGCFKLKINLNKGKYNIICNYKGSSKYDSCIYFDLLNVSFAPNLVYSVNMTIKNAMTVGNKEYLVPYGREIGIYKNNVLYKFGYDYSTASVTKLDYDKLYFVSLSDNDSIRVITSELDICSSGFSLFSNGSNVFVKFYGYQNENLTRFDVIFDGKKYLSNQIENVTLLQGGLFVGSFYFSCELITSNTKSFLSNIGVDSNYKYYNGVYTNFTVLDNSDYVNPDSVSCKNLRYGDTSYDNELNNRNWSSSLGYEFVESFLSVGNFKISDSVFTLSLNKSSFKNQADYVVYNAYLTNLCFRWLSDKLADEISDNYGITWFRGDFSCTLSRTDIGLGGTHFDNEDYIVFKGDRFVSYKANNEYYLKGSVLEEYVMFLHGSNSTCGVKEVINALINGGDLYCNISSNEFTLGLMDNSSTLIFDLINGGVDSLIRPNILMNLTFNGGLSLNIFSFLNPTNFLNSVMGIYNVIKSPDDLAGFICDEMGWDERYKMVLSTTLDIAVSAAIIGLAIAFPELSVSIIVMKFSYTLWSNNIFKDPFNRENWGNVAIDLIIGWVGGKVMGSFVSKPTKSYKAVEESLWFFNVEAPIDTIRFVIDNLGDNKSDGR